MLTHRQRSDSFNIDPAELKLIRVGHALWGLLRLERRVLGETISEQRALQRGLPTARPSPSSPETDSIETAIQIIVRLKGEKRADLKILRVERSKRTADYFMQRKGILTEK